MTYLSLPMQSTLCVPLVYLSAATRWEMKVFPNLCFVLCLHTYLQKPGPAETRWQNLGSSPGEALCAVYILTCRNQVTALRVSPVNAFCCVYTLTCRNQVTALRVSSSPNWKSQGSSTVSHSPLHDFSSLTALALATPPVHRKPAHPANSHGLMGNIVTVGPTNNCHGLMDNTVTAGPTKNCHGLMGNIYLQDQKQLSRSDG